jgi:prepilin peptidase dependent protein B
MFMTRRTSCRRATRGLSLVELMVGIVVGLFIVSGGVYFAVNFNAENRRLLLEARLTQDMRAAMDIVTRDIRRAGYWQNAASGVTLFGSTVVPVSYDATAFAALTPASGASAAAVTYAYDKSASAAATAADQSAFALSGGVLTTTIGGSGAQPLTDSGTTTVTAFTVTQQATSEPIACSASCVGAACPMVHVRELTVTLSASSAIDSSIARTLKNRVRIRNDLHTGSC